MTAEAITAQRNVELLRMALKDLPAIVWKLVSKKPEAGMEPGSASYDGIPAYVARDDGAGFEVVHAGKPFGAFRRLHRAGQSEGTVIGLSAARRVIRHHGGRIWAEDEVGRGATFCFASGVGRPGSGASLEVARTK